jgi:hypothetical protein
MVRIALFLILLSLASISARAQNPDAEAIKTLIAKIEAEIKFQGAANSQQLSAIAERLGKIEAALRSMKRTPIWLNIPNMEPSYCRTIGYPNGLAIPAIGINNWGIICFD